MDTLKPRLATVWLGGCSGCHMSFLDLDEWLFDLAAAVDIVYSPIADVKIYPENVDICLVEGAVANEENLEIAKIVRKNTKTVVSFGDCAVTANVPGMRNMLDSSGTVLERSYLELGDTTPQLPHEPGIVPELLDRVLPLHQAIEVDYFMPGCPPDAPRIKAFIEALLAGHAPELVRETIKFG
jgi:NAD-reducing hydrogenase small subunit